MKSITSTFKTAAITTALLCQANALNAAPLPDGTILLLEPGANPDATGKCQTGSCFGMEVSPDFWIWTMIEPGNDGGFVVGKNQLSGGQEVGLSADNVTAADISAAWFFFGAYGTFFADNTANTFSDTSNDGGTVLGDINVAWNGGVTPIGRGGVNDYSITLDGAGGGSWSMEYLQYIPTFSGTTLRLLVRGDVTVPIATNNNPPVVNDVFIVAESGVFTNWAPDFSDDAGDTHICTIETNALNGNATVNTDCSGGTYTSGSGYFGVDSFEYSVTDQHGLSATGIATVEIHVGCVLCACTLDYPIRQVTTVGGGQSPVVNGTVMTTFTGHIMTDTGLTTGGKNSVKICPGTTLDFETTATTGTASCIINSAVTASIGRLAVGDKLICTNKPDGGDVDRFSIKSGL